MTSTVRTGGVTSVSPNSSFAICGVSFTSFTILASVCPDSTMVVRGRRSGNASHTRATRPAMFHSEHSSAAGSATVSTLVIEKGIPLPPTRGGKPGTRSPARPSMAHATFVQMEVGDSFLQLTPDGLSAKRHNARLSAQACMWTRTHAPGRKFTTRREGDGIRIWRVA